MWSYSVFDVVLDVVEPGGVALDLLARLRLQPMHLPVEPGTGSYWMPSTICAWSAALIFAVTSTVNACGLTVKSARRPDSRRIRTRVARVRSVSF